MKKKEVLAFIARFATHEAVIETFTTGCCYWFAKILEYRFLGELMYDPIDCHFGCKIRGKVYDITGDVTDGHTWKPWMEVYKEDPRRGERIYRDCIL